MTKRGKIITWSVVGVAAAVIVVGAIVASRGPKTTYETEKVTRGSVVEEVTVTGSLTPAKRIELQPEASGKVSVVNIKEGQEVKSGAVLVEIDARDLNARISSQRAAVAAAVARLDELVAGPTQQELALAEGAVAAARTKLEAAVSAKTDAETALANARVNYENAVAKAETQLESKRAQLVIDLGEASTAANDAISRLTGTIFTTDGQLTFTSSNSTAETDARNSFAAAKSALSDIEDAVASAQAGGTVAAALASHAQVSAGLGAVKRNLDDDVVLLNYASSLDSSTKASYQATVNTALGNINGSLQAIANSKASLDLQANLNASDIQSAQSAISAAESSVNAAAFAISSAQRSLEQAEADLAFKRTGSRPEAIAAQRAQVRVQQASLEVLLADLSKRRLVAPIDGVVTDVNVEKGETVSPGSPAVIMNAKGNFEIITNISEIDIAKVAVGDTVTITLDSFPRTDVWTGKVARIDSREKVVDSVIFYETTVIFDSEDPRLRPGMTANLSIETERRDDVLRVPLRGVKERGEKTFVELLIDGSAVEREITIGIENSINAEAVSGVVEGDDVIVATKTDGKAK